VKKFWKSVKKWQSYGHEFGVSLFLEHGVYKRPLIFIVAP